MVPGHCAGSCTPSMGSPYPPCMMGAAMCGIVRLLHNCGNGLGNGRPVVLVAVRPVQHQGGQQLCRRQTKGQFGAKSVRALPLVEEWPIWTGRDPYPTPSMAHFYEQLVCRPGVQPGPFVWPQATSGPKPLFSDLLPSTKVLGQSRSGARQRSSLLP